jgi:hypothetical protein
VKLLFWSFLGGANFFNISLGLCGLTLLLLLDLFNSFLLCYTFSHWRLVIWLRVHIFLKYSLRCMNLNYYYYR